MAIEQMLEAVLLNVDQEFEFDRIGILWIITYQACLTSARSSRRQGKSSASTEVSKLSKIITDSQSAIRSLQQGPTHVLQHSRITANAKLMREPLFDNYLSCSVDATF